MNEEMLYKAIGLKEQSEELEKNIEFVNEQLAELVSLEESLSFFDEREKEILAPLGKGIYLKSERKEDEFFVGVGAGIIVKKTPEEVRKIVQSQIVKLKETRMRIILKLEEYSREFGKMMGELEGVKG
ncbi:prefoldin subunit alpha [Candidatus Pacearchaeota archaeon]|nr:prefoldin subunit alpha [Candidatus Pacearchaeota archaeon]